MTESQLASTVLMIRPVRFESNPQTAASNQFQEDPDATPQEQQAAASREFDGLVDALRDAGVRVIVVDVTEDPEEEKKFMALINPEIIEHQGTQVDEELLKHAKKLKMVARAGVGIDNVDVPAASERGIIVVNAPFGNTNSAAEHSMAILLAMCRNVPLANASLKSGHHPRHQRQGRGVDPGRVERRTPDRPGQTQPRHAACDEIRNDRAKRLDPKGAVRHQRIRREPLER